MLYAVVETSVPLETSTFDYDCANFYVNAILVLITLVSVICAYFAYRFQKRRKRKETACDLAKFYADVIIDKYAIVQNVLSNGIKDENIKSIFDFKQIKDFDEAELKRFLAKHSKDISMFRAKFYDIDPRVILSAKIAYSPDIEKREMIACSYVHYDPASKEGKLNVQMLRQDYISEVFSLLNQLEWFSMNCRYEVADEGLLYQSLHQTFLSTIWKLYFYIAQANKSNEDKLYTNAIWLFLKWRNRLLQIQDKTEKKRDKLNKKAEKKKREAEKLKKKEESIQPPVHHGNSV